MVTEVAPVLVNLVKAYLDLTVYEVSLEKHGYPFYYPECDNW